MRKTVNGKALACGAVITASIVCAFLFNLSYRSGKELENLKSRSKEIALLRDEYLSLKAKVDSVEGRKNLTQVRGIVQAVEEVFLSAGLKQKLKSVKPTGVKELKDAVEEEADVHAEKVDINEAVNIFYRIENAPAAISIKKTVIKTSFDSPALLNITMTLALIKQK